MDRKQAKALLVEKKRREKGRKERRRKKGRKEGEKEGEKEGRKEVLDFPWYLECLEAKLLHRSEMVFCFWVDGFPTRESGFCSKPTSACHPTLKNGP